MAFAALLKQLCEDAGLKERGRQADIVRLFKHHGIVISQPAVKKYFDGEALPDMDKALVLAKAFDYNVNDLLSGTKKTTKSKNFDQVNQSPVTYSSWPFGEKITPDEYNSLLPKQKELVIARILTYLDDNSIK
ncbi:MAG TPA: hypothetical protein VK958_06415 [Methylophilus sp.]|uniref:hypothetical protein n=1 Tax=Methylophilus sp. TaxID=29541 RepID=UPI002BFC26EB|nr:hypothetical protein [Methylophilus sp.]HSH86868.1 hypothetical protein [Methylophilus sp.]